MKLSELKPQIITSLEALRVTKFQNPGQTPMLPAVDVLNIFLILITEIEEMKQAIPSKNDTSLGNFNAEQN